MASKLLMHLLELFSQPFQWNLSLQTSPSSHCRYSDYTRTESGLQYQDLREGTGKSAMPGAQVTVDWDGYTIGMDPQLQVLSTEPTLSGTTLPSH